MEAVASLDQLTWRRAGDVILDGVTLRLRAGEVVGLIGPNGAGKSSLLLMLAGLLTPTSGQVCVAGLSPARLAVERTGTVGLITASAGLYPLLTGRENLHFFGALYGLSAAETDARVAPLLDELQMDRALARPVAEYSSGMQQKVSLARALLMEPLLLLLDEPTSNLDPISAEVLYAAVRSRADSGLSVVLATHDLYAVERYCDRAVLLSQRVRAILNLGGAKPRPPSALTALWREQLGGGT